MQATFLKAFVMVLVALTLSYGHAYAGDVKRKFGQAITVYKTPIHRRSRRDRAD